MAIDRSSRRPSGVTFWVIAIVLVGQFAYRLANDRAPARPADTNIESAAPYQAEVEEGVGAAVAILVDTSGSMRDAAEGDPRPKYVVAQQAI